MWQNHVVMLTKLHIKVLSKFMPVIVVIFHIFNALYVYSVQCGSYRLS